MVEDPSGDLLWMQRPERVIDDNSGSVPFWERYSNCLQSLATHFLRSKEWALPMRVVHDGVHEFVLGQS